MAQLGQHPKSKQLYLGSIPFAAAPFLAPLVLGGATGLGLSLVWIAFAAFVGVAGIVSLVGARVVHARALAVLAALGVLAGLVAVLGAIWLLGITSSSRATALALGAAFALSFGISHLLDRLSRPGALDHSGAQAG